MHRLLLLAWSGLAACAAGAERPTDTASRDGSVAVAAPTTVAAAPAEQPRAVLVELFTSQGCSSCPPADRVLAELERSFPDVDIVPLAFHVDYWNDLGWRDPFSSERWSHRQRRYAKVLPRGRVYTPMMVFDGREHVVGSRRAEVAEAIERAAGRSTDSSIEARFARADGAITVDIAASSSRPARAVVALYQRSATTRVRAGENSGRRLRDDYIVRALQQPFVLAAGQKRSESIELAVADELADAELGVAVFLHAPDTLEVLATARARPLTP